MHSIFQQLYEKYHQDVFQFIFYMVKSRETAEDLMQEVYIKVMNNYEKFEGKSSERTWLYSIARNTAIDYYRKQKNWKQRLSFNFEWGRDSIKDDQPLPEEVALLNDDIKSVYKSLEKCTIDQKTVLILRYVQDLSIVETAEILNWTVSKVKTTQHRALKTLKASYVFEEHGEEGQNDEKINTAGK